jgi:NAD(P)-dependent dehydrogenase (short-subunit alcohol dehydrogenase family)
MFIQFSSYNHPIVSVELNENKDILLFKTTLYTYRFEALGDCCSVSQFKKFEDIWDDRAPLGWDVSDPIPVAKTVLALMSDWFPATTGEVIHVDGGFHAMGA